MTRKESTINIERIEAAKDVATLRELLQLVEGNIKGIIGKNPLSFYLERPSHNIMEEIDDYIGLRTVILDKMFTYSPDEIERMEQVNTLLTDLRRNMYRRTCALYRTLLAHGVDESFDDDYEVEGKLAVGVEYDSNEGDFGTVLHLENDAYYGSDFAYMLYVIMKTEEERRYALGYIDKCCVRHNERNTPDMTDKELLAQNFAFLVVDTSWDERLHHNDLKHICFGYAFHSLYTHNPYALADILRINSFVVNVQLVCLQLTDQAGRRYKDITKDNE
ncbi:hypothetical protein ABVC70_04225 [Hoylesella timonensis]|uniref:hypothetical protein n=1 Tax=Hoylesella timonensis TaxID=386414 RepID=UPI00336A61ED